MPDFSEWRHHTTVSQWFMERTQLSYQGRIVVVTGYTPKDVDIFNGSTTFTLPIETAARVLIPTGGERQHREQEDGEL